MSDNFYKGLAFPFKKGTTSFPEGAVDDALIKDEITQLLMTAPTERVMRPELGTPVHPFTFETNDELLSSNIRTVVANAISKFESRVLLRGIEVQRASSDGNDTNRLDHTIITVTYVVPATQKQGQVTVQMGLSQSPVSG